MQSSNAKAYSLVTQQGAKAYSLVTQQGSKVNQGGAHLSSQLRGITEGMHLGWAQLPKV